MHKTHSLLSVRFILCTASCLHARNISEFIGVLLLNNSIIDKILFRFQHEYLSNASKSKLRSSIIIFLLTCAEYFSRHDGFINGLVNIVNKIHRIGFKRIVYGWIYTFQCKRKSLFLDKTVFFSIGLNDRQFNETSKSLLSLFSEECYIETFQEGPCRSSKNLRIAEKLGVKRALAHEPNATLEEFLTFPECNYNVFFFPIEQICHEYITRIRTKNIFSIICAICNKTSNLPDEKNTIIDDIDYVLYAASDEKLSETAGYGEEVKFVNINSSKELLCFLISHGIGNLNRFMSAAPDIRELQSVPGEPTVSICMRITRHNEVAPALILAAVEVLREPYEVVFWGPVQPDWIQKFPVSWHFIPSQDDDQATLREVTSACRGEFLLFIHDDVVPIKGLGKALEILRREPRALMCGFRLFSEHGSLYEAGACEVDGIIKSAGWGAKPSAPFYRITRSVPYVSARACWVRRTDDLFGTGGSLRLTAGENGHLGITDSTKLALICGETYCVLTGEEEPDVLDTEQNERVALRLAAQDTYRPSMPHGTHHPLNILYYSPYPSHPASHGNRSTIQHFGKIFQSKGCKVHFALLELDNYSPADMRDMNEAWDSFTILPYPFNDYSSLGIDISFDGWYTHGLGEHVALLCQLYDIDLLFCSYIFQSKMLEFIPRHIVKVIDTHDRMSGRYAAQKARGLKTEFFSCTAEDEGRYLRRADIVVSRREEEARLFNEESGQDTAIVIPHVEPPHASVRHFTSLRALGIVASANKINLDLVADFIAALAERANGAPPFSLRVAGQVAEMVPDLPPAQRRLFNAPWVTMLGFVDDIGEFYASVDCIVSPVTYGTGINVKTVQAMSYGMPVVSTACGSKGIETENPMHNHTSQDEVITSLLHLSEHPDLLEDLALCSRRRYATFYTESLKGFDTLLAYCANNHSRRQL